MTVLAEREKYLRVWEHEDYRRFSPGATHVEQFLQIVSPPPGARILDLGAGTGRASLELAQRGYEVAAVDFAPNALDPPVRAALQPGRLEFIEHDLEQPLPCFALYGFCCDVLEHIRPIAVDAVLLNILRKVQHAWFSIATTPDHMGELIGEPLHLTVRPYAWWLEQFARLGAVVRWSNRGQGVALFYVSTWGVGEDFVDVGTLNVPDEEVRQHIAHNTAQGWSQIEPHEALPHERDLEVLILGGGPSLALAEDDIRQRRLAGAKLVTLNGTYTWALERGLTPSATIIVDARAFNARFVRPVVDHCRYLLASQCHPDVFEGLPRDRTYLWHGFTRDVHGLLNGIYPRWYGIPGGTTVLLRAIPLLRTLGYRRFHLYGCDSCLTEDGRHHAYDQPENGRDVVIPVLTDDGRLFWCSPWMVTQAQEFQYLIRHLGSEFELEVHGDGLLAHILQVAAARAHEEED